MESMPLIFIALVGIPLLGFIVSTVLNLVAVLADGVLVANVIKHGALTSAAVLPRTFL